MAQEEKKTWYQSKIFMLALAGVGIFAYSLLQKFLGEQGVTPEQIEVIQTTHPEIAEAVKQLATGENVTDAAGVLLFGLVAIFRKWFTFKLLS